MGVAVLSPQDCLQNPWTSREALICPPRSKHQPRNPNPNAGRPNRSQPNRRKRSPTSLPQSRAVVASHAPAKSLVMGQVKILKRGEQLSETTSEKVSHVEKGGKVEDLDLGSTHRLGPDPELVPTQIRLAEPTRADGFYAGSAFITSPPPSSLPLPAFFMKKTVKNEEDLSSALLRRILKIDGKPVICH